MTSPSNSPQPAGRVASVDALRGMTILLMVFVNDLGGAAPSWMGHIQPPDADGMTLADVVFPGFLFIAGVSIPLAFDRARQRGASTWNLLGHVIIRSLALLVMGLIEFNKGDETVLGPTRWGLLAYVAIIMAWCVVPRETGMRRTIFMGMKILGIAGVITLLAVFRREPVDTEILLYGPVENWVWIQTGWWGILGLIGWSYLTVSLLYLLLGSRREWLMGSMALLMLLYLVMDNGGFFTRVMDKSWLAGAETWLSYVETGLSELNRFVSIGSTLGSHPAITMCGCLLGTILISRSDVASPSDRVRWGLGFALGLFIAGLLTDTFAGINKIGATPTWCLWCASLTCSTWVLLYVLMDVRGWTSWSIIVRPAGANPLIAYLLHPILIWSLSLAGFHDDVRYYSSSSDPTMVVIGSAAMAFVVCAVTGMLARTGVRLRV